CVAGYLQDVDSQRKDFFVVINDEYRVAGLRHGSSHGVGALNAKRRRIPQENQNGPDDSSYRIGSACSRVVCTRGETRRGARWTPGRSQASISSIAFIKECPPCQSIGSGPCSHPTPEVARHLLVNRREDSILQTETRCINR